VLSDEQKREVYDRFGHQGLRGGAQNGSPFDNFGMGDLFEAFFGGMGQGTHPDSSGADLAYELTITLEDAASGVERSIHVGHHIPCATCNGSGARDGNVVACPACAGTGQRRQSATNILGFNMTTLVPCDRCGGTGELIANPCRVCGGTGRVQGVEDISVSIPAGVEHGMKFRVRGKGEAGFRGARAGDLYVIVGVRAHPRFQRQGRDLFCVVDLPITTAALGGRIAVPTLDGEGEVDIPAGTQYGEKFRLRGKGMPDLHGHARGDLYAQVKLIVPTDLSTRQRELLAQLADERGEDGHLKSRGTFQRLKDAAQHLLNGEPDAPRGTGE